MNYTFSGISAAGEVKAFLTNGWVKKIHLEQFPAYALELIKLRINNRYNNYSRVQGRSEA